VPRLIAHRGASGHAPENTLSAFDLALELGADALELDVRVAGDGRLITLHDATLERTTGDPRRHDELVGAVDHPAAPADLEDVLARYGRRISLIVDLKDPDPAWELGVVDALERHGLREHAAVQSFDHAALARVHHAAPWLPLAALYRREDAEFVEVADVPAWAATVGLWHELIDATFVGEAHLRGLRVQPHTVDDRASAERVVALGVDAVVSNVPDVVAPVVQGRDVAQWPLRPAGAPSVLTT
jgi:glycerophosphoryl diester phosphodiesterase